MLNKCSENMICDVRGCKKAASASFEVKGLLKKIYLCADCQRRLFDDLSKTNITKSPKNKISSVMEEKQGVIKSGR